MVNTLKRHPRIFWPAISLSVVALATVLLLAQWGIPGRVSAQETVDVSILDSVTGLSTLTVNSGDKFSMTVRVHASGDRQVNGADIFVNFDPAVLRVDGGAAGLSVFLPGSFLEVVPATVNNGIGTINVSVGTLNPLDPFGAPFDLFTIDFRALKTSDGTPVTFETVDPVRETKINFVDQTTFEVLTVTGILNPATVTVTAPVVSVDQWNAQLAIAGAIGAQALVGGVDLDFGLDPDAASGALDVAWVLADQQLDYYFQQLTLPFGRLTRSKLHPTPPLEWTLSIKADSPFGAIPVPLTVDVTITPSLTDVPAGFVVNLLATPGRSLIATLQDGVGVPVSMVISIFSVSSPLVSFIVQVVPAGAIAPGAHTA